MVYMNKMHNKSASKLCNHSVIWLKSIVPIVSAFKLRKCNSGSFN